MGGPLRVLHVAVNMNRGGAETLIMNIYRNIDRSMIQFDFLTCKPGDFDEEVKKMGGKIHRIPYISDVGHFNYIQGLRRFFTANSHYKIIHSHLDKMSGIVLREAKKAGIPVRVSHSHNTKSEGGAAARTYKWLVGNFIATSATTFFACSNDAAKWLFNKKSNKTMILKNGIEYDKFTYSDDIRKQVRLELNLKEKDFVLGHVGRFNHQKNHSFLIDIFAKLQKLNKDSVLLLVGDGEERSAIEKKIRTLKLEKSVRFLGVRKDIERVLQGMDLFVFPSLHEGLPVSLIEAQGAGLPCIISDRISNEVDLGMDLIEYAPLEDIDLWIKKIQKAESQKTSRMPAYDSLINSGFDIRDTAKKMEHFYLSC
ncbi:glycosyltransferase family 1 protein [Lederbergia panacisoli]|uniref:glycosyltransferase family 1 protein n=1 Tax=Lederbergia panacisoli TaxID=1255251 RepID=UPI00214D0A36|nr:glycosyltransferase family 1 protein [Lederbergia panacisoli]MCR2822039.1 glycosyltransferase family 1 protein [Lederbergia panacisoli]